MSTHWAPGNADLPASGVTPGIYGDATHVGQVTVAASGLVTAAASVAITGGGGGTGVEISYDEITGFVNITSTNIAAPTSVIAGSSAVYDGSPVIVQFYAPAVSAPAAIGSQVEISLTMDGADLGRGLFSAGTNTSFASNNGAANIWLRTTPSAGSHAFAVTAFVQSTTGTPAVAAGAGGVGGIIPAFLRVVKV